jgi:HEAT repeat protein
MATLLTDPALGALADELAEPLFAGMSDADLRQAALAWLRMGRRLFEALLPRLLALPRDALVEPLLRFAACGDDPSGEEAAKARARVEDLFAFHGIGAALPILADGSLDPRLRSAAAAALGRAGRTEAIAPLLGAAAAPERSVRIAAIAALGELDDGSGTQVATLARALEGDDRAERKAAAVALGRLGAAAGVEGLLPLLESDDPGLRADAHWALKEITGRPFGPEPATWRAYWAAERRRADEQLPLVLLELSSGEPALVVGAMREAAALTAGRDRVRVALRPLLAAEAPSVRAAACVALAELRDRSAVPRLVAMLDDPDAAVWEAAWRALRRITGKDLPPRAAAWRAR